MLFKHPKSLLLLTILLALVNLASCALWDIRNPFAAPGDAGHHENYANAIGYLDDGTPVPLLDLYRRDDVSVRSCSDWTYSPAVDIWSTDLSCECLSVWRSSFAWEREDDFVLI